MKNFFKFIKSYIFYTLSAFGISLGITASIGVSSFNSMNLSVANASGLKVGTVTIIFNIIFLLLYILATRFKEVLKYIIQGVSVFMFGYLINYFTYDLLGRYLDIAYINRIIIFSIGTVISGLSGGMIIHYNVITFPLENLCVELSKKNKVSFIKLRYLVDIISVMISVIISLIDGLPIYVREGTIISMILLSPTMNYSKGLAKRKSKKIFFSFAWKSNRKDL